MTKKKVAILFYGRIFLYDTVGYNSIIDNFSEKYDLDFFLSTSPELNEDVSGFVNLFNPISYSNDKIDISIDLNNYTKSDYIDFNKCKNAVPHFFNKYRVFQLLDEYILKSNTKYDYVFCTRVDVFYYNGLDFESFIKIDNNNIYIPDGNLFGQPCPPGVNDHMAVGNYNSIKKYTDLYLYLKEYLDNGCIIRPETILLNHLIKMDLKVTYYIRNYGIIPVTNPKYAEKVYKYYLYYKSKNIKIPHWEFAVLNVDLESYKQIHN